MVNGEHHTEQYQYTVFWPTENTDLDMSIYQGQSILIGHLNNHFQSLNFSHDTGYQSAQTSIPQGAVNIDTELSSSSSQNSIDFVRHPTTDQQKITLPNKNKIAGKKRKR